MCERTYILPIYILHTFNKRIIVPNIEGNANQEENRLTLKLDEARN